MHGESTKIGNFNGNLSIKSGLGVLRIFKPRIFSQPSVKPRIFGNPGLRRPGFYTNVSTLFPALDRWGEGAGTREKVRHTVSRKACSLRMDPAGEMERARPQPEHSRAQPMVTPGGTVSSSSSTPAQSGNAGGGTQVIIDGVRIS